MNVDIIIPAYNPGPYLFEALDSCQKQSYRHFNVIVVDDCSTEVVEPVVKRYGYKYVRNNTNLGPGASRNIGIANSTADLISFLDSDDVMDQNKLFHSVEVFKKHKDVDLVCGNYRRILKNGRITNQFYRNKVDINFKALLRQNYIASGSVTVRRSALERVGGFDERFWIAEDYSCWLKIALLGEINKTNNIHYIHKTLYHYRYIPGGGSLTDRSDIQKKHLENIKIIKEEALQKLKESQNAGL